MKQDWSAGHLDIQAFAGAGARFAGIDSLPHFPRLLSESAGDADAYAAIELRWQATGDMRASADGLEAPWLRLTADATLPLVCQRCGEPVDQALHVDRWFRFVVDEATAEREDEDAEEDVLVTSRNFDLYGLIEDELLLALPITPRHDGCPTDVRLSTADPGADAEPTAGRPFDVLKNLPTRRSDAGDR